MCIQIHKERFAQERLRITTMRKAIQPWSPLVVTFITHPLKSWHGSIFGYCLKFYTNKYRNLRVNSTMEILLNK